MSGLTIDNYSAPAKKLGRPSKEETVISTSLTMDRPTLREVAKAAGVSVTTASNVINGKFSLMSEETRRRVEDTVRSLHYRVNAKGRSLRSAKGTTVAFIALDDDASFLRDPFTAETVAGFANAIVDEGFDPIINRIDPNRIEQHSLFSTDDVQGLCMSLQGWSRERQRAVERLATLRLPIVLIQNAAPPDVSDVCVVQQDDFGGGIMLAHHLRTRGARHVLLVRQEVNWTSIESRAEGISTVFAGGAADLKLDRLSINHAAIVADVREKLTAYLADGRRPDAIMAANDQIAAACINVLHSQRIRVPQDIAVTGFNGFDIFDMLPYRLTTIYSPAYELGVRGGQELVHRLRTGSFRATEITLSVRMKQGDTA